MPLAQASAPRPEGLAPRLTAQTGSENFELAPRHRYFTPRRASVHKQKSRVSRRGTSKWSRGARSRIQLKIPDFFHFSHSPLQIFGSSSHFLSQNFLPTTPCSSPFDSSDPTPLLLVIIHLHWVILLLGSQERLQKGDFGSSPFQLVFLQNWWVIFRFPTLSATLC